MLMQLQTVESFCGLCMKHMRLLKLWVLVPKVSSGLMLGDIEPEGCIWEKMEGVRLDTQ